MDTQDNLRDEYNSAGTWMMTEANPFPEVRDEATLYALVNLLEYKLEEYNYI